jgi:hypothetical protein
MRELPKPHYRWSWVRQCWVLAGAWSPAIFLPEIK